MSVILWSILALAGGLGAVWVTARRARSATAPWPDDVELPATPMQRVARWSIGAGGVLAAVAAALVLMEGATATFERDSVRIVFTSLLVAVLAVVGAANVWIRSQASRRDGLLDERDRLIFGQAPAVQATGMLVTQAIWTVGLAESFHDAGTLPVFYLYLMFWSALVVHMLGLPVGILVGYRRR